MPGAIGGEVPESGRGLGDLGAFFARGFGFRDRADSTSASANGDGFGYGAAGGRGFDFFERAA